MKKTKQKCLSQNEQVACKILNEQQIREWESGALKE